MVVSVHWTAFHNFNSFFLSSSIELIRQKKSFDITFEVFEVPMETISNNSNTAL